MGILWAHTGTIGCIVFNLPILCTNSISSLIVCYVQGLVYVQGSVSHRAASAAELMELFQSGSKNRHTASTSKSPDTVQLSYRLGTT